MFRRHSHVDLVDLVLQLVVRGKLLEKRLLLVFVLSVSVLVVAVLVAAGQLGLRLQVVGQTPASGRRAGGEREESGRRAGGEREESERRALASA